MSSGIFILLCKHHHHPHTGHCQLPKPKVHAHWTLPPCLFPSSPFLFASMNLTILGLKQMNHKISFLYWLPYLTSEMFSRFIHIEGCVILPFLRLYWIAGTYVYVCTYTIYIFCLFIHWQLLILSLYDTFSKPYNRSSSCMCNSTEGFSLS